MKDVARQAIIEAFTTGWDTAIFKVVTENNPIEQNAGATLPWGRLSLQMMDPQPASIGTGHLRMGGMIFLQVFLPLNKGTKRAYAAADKIDAIFRFTRLTFTPPTGGRGFVEFEAGCSGPVSAGTRDGYAQHNITINFRAETGR
jgi:hypothetical protein